MSKVVIEVESKLDKQQIEAIIKEASQEIGMRSMVEEVAKTLPKTALLTGLLASKPKGKVTTTIK